MVEPTIDQRTAIVPAIEQDWRIPTKEQEEEDEEYERFLTGFIIADFEGFLPGFRRLPK